MKRKRRTISYPSDVTPDLLELLGQLREVRDGPYWKRSLSDIGGMILLKAAQTEVEKYIDHPKTSKKVRGSNGG